ncbi:MAG: hypothetical protein ACLTAI_10140 [Thomasclavelia sp.]
MHRTCCTLILKLKWDDRNFIQLNIPKCILPEVKQSSEIYGYLGIISGRKSQYSRQQETNKLFIWTNLFNAGRTKYIFRQVAMLMNTGETQFIQKMVLFTTIALRGLDGKVNYTRRFDICSWSCYTMA